MKFVKLTEYNGWEGETWNFWLQVDNNRAELNKLKKRLDRFADDGDVIFQLSLEEVDEAEVNTLVKHNGDDGYYPANNKITGEFKLSDVDDETLEQDLYKGGVKDMFKNE